MICEEIKDTRFNAYKIRVTSPPEKEDNCIGACRHECPTAELDNRYKLEVFEEDLASACIDTTVREDARWEDDRRDPSLSEELFGPLDEEALYL